MRILVVDGPGRHPAYYPRVLGSALHRRGHGVIVHPARDASNSWPGRHAFRKRAKEVVAVHQPDVVHVIAAEPWVADAFGGRGLPVIHSGEGRCGRADWSVVPTHAALNRAAGDGAGPDFRVGHLPYAFDIASEAAPGGDFALAYVPAGDAAARRVLNEIRIALPDVPIRDSGDPREARFVLALGTDPAAWPAGVGEGLSAGRPVLASWGGTAQEFLLEGVTGFMAAPGDAASVAAQAKVLWEQPEECGRMGAEALRHAREQFDAEDHAKALLRWYLRAGASRLAV
jgi:hypothetical protein